MYRKKEDHLPHLSVAS